MTDITAGHAPRGRAGQRPPRACWRTSTPRTSSSRRSTGPQGVLGALTFVLGDSGRRFEDDDLQLIRSLGDASGAAHRERPPVHRALAIAQTLQASLQPRALPEIPGVELAAHYRPAGDQNTVGGDFYDVFRSEGRALDGRRRRRLGQGRAAAAALTALARYTLRGVRTYARRSRRPTSRCSTESSTTTRTPETSAPSLYARVRPGPAGLDVRFANGGHLPPLLLRPDGTIESDRRRPRAARRAPSRTPHFERGDAARCGPANCFCSTPTA